MDQQGVSPHTIAAYRDTVRLLMASLARQGRTSPCQLTLNHLDAPTVLAFLVDLETRRGNSVRTRNARLAAVRAFIAYASARSNRVAARTARAGDPQKAIRPAFAGLPDAGRNVSRARRPRPHHVERPPGQGVLGIVHTPG